MRFENHSSSFRKSCQALWKLDISQKIARANDEAGAGEGEYARRSTANFGMSLAAMK